MSNLVFLVDDDAGRMTFAFQGKERPWRSFTEQELFQISQICMTYFALEHQLGDPARSAL
jgi:hypothetical protein